MIVVALLVILGIALWQIFGPTPNPSPPNPGPPGPPGPNPQSNNWPRIKEVFFVAISSTDDIVDGGNVFPNQTELLAPELKPAFYKRHFFYDMATTSQINNACAQGFSPPGPSTGKPGQYFSNTFDPTNILLMSIQPFIVGTSKSFIMEVSNITCYIGLADQSGGQFCDQVAGFGSAITNNLQIIPRQKGTYSMIPTITGATGCPQTIVKTNCLNSGPQITPGLVLNTSCGSGKYPQSITYPVYGYKPAQELNTTTGEYVFQSSFLSDSAISLTDNLSSEIVPYSVDSWYYYPISSNGSNYTNGYELIVFKVDSSKIPLSNSDPGYFPIFSKSYKVATLDDLEYSFSKGYNRTEYIYVSEQSQTIFANVIMTPGDNFGINLYKLGAVTPLEGTLPMSSGQYSGTVLVQTRDNFVDSASQNVITWPSCKNPQPTIGNIVYIAFWGIKPTPTNWITELLTPKAQTFAPAYIELLPFTDGSVGAGFFSQLFGTSSSKWSMYS